MADSGSPTDSRRRSSEASKFANLMHHKRNSQDDAGAARRASITDQYQQKGFVGKMWDNFTKGASETKPASTATTQGSISTQIPKQSISRTGAGTLG